MVIGADGNDELCAATEAIQKIFRFVEHMFPLGELREYTCERPELEGMNIIEAKNRYLHRSALKCWDDVAIPHAVCIRIVMLYLTSLLTLLCHLDRPSRFSRYSCLIWPLPIHVGQCC